MVRPGNVVHFNLHKRQYVAVVIIPMPMSEESKNDHFNEVVRKKSNCSAVIANITKDTGR